MLLSFFSPGYYEDRNEVQLGSRSENRRVRQLHREDIYHVRRRRPRVLNNYHFT